MNTFELKHIIPSRNEFPTDWLLLSMCVYGFHGGLGPKLRLREYRILIMHIGWCDHIVRLFLICIGLFCSCDLMTHIHQSTKDDYVCFCASCFNPWITLDSDKLIVVINDWQHPTCIIQCIRYNVYWKLVYQLWTWVFTRFHTTCLYTYIIYFCKWDTMLFGFLDWSWNLYLTQILVLFFTNDTPDVTMHQSLKGTQL